MDLVAAVGQAAGERMVCVCVVGDDGCKEGHYGYLYGECVL